MKESSPQDTPVFIQGLPRSRTTYLWSKFRNNYRNTSYYEPLHPLLSSGNRKNTVSSKSLRHPALLRPLFDEYPEDVYASADLAIKDYHLEKGEKAPQLKNYVAKLIEIADGRPVFKFVRGTLRGEWLAENFSGVHLYIDRDLPGLVNSYYSFRGKFSWYLSEFVTVVGANANSKIFSELADYLGIKEIEGNYSELKEHYRKILLAKFKEEKYSRQTMVDMVAFFRELGLKRAEEYASAIFGTEELKDESKRQQVEEKLSTLTGDDIDLTDFKMKATKNVANPSANIIGIIKRAQMC